MLAHIHEKLQELMYLTGGMWSDGDNPVAPVYHVPRPTDIFGPSIEDEDVSEDAGELSAAFDK